MKAITILDLNYLQSYYVLLKMLRLPIKRPYALLTQCEVFKRKCDNCLLVNLVIMFLNLAFTEVKYKCKN